MFKNTHYTVYVEKVPKFEANMIFGTTLNYINLRFYVNIYFTTEFIF